MSAIAEAERHVAVPEFRSAGTDLSERRRSGISHGPVVDLAPTPGMKGVTWQNDRTAHVGALTTIAEIAENNALAASYPGLAATAAALATPQIRNRATIGGNLAQRTRCWYFRNPQFACHKKGGTTCPARDGNHLYGAMFDLGPCVAVHPSSMAAALLAYDAQIQTDRRLIAVAELLGDGSDGRVDNALQTGEIIRSVVLPQPMVGEQAFYKRAIGRAHAEWPLVEMVLRVIVKDDRFALVRVAVGGVAAIPMRLPQVEEALTGIEVTRVSLDATLADLLSSARPLPLTGYKVALLKGLAIDLFGNVKA